MKTSFGKYQVKRELGKGAMGVVYLAFDPVLEREVAIKTISSTESDADLKERFIREARSAGKMRHSNIITIFDFGEEDGILYIVMELLEGRDLDEIIAEKPQMDIKQKLEILRQICMGLEYAHKNNIYHRDIKPANIKVLSDGTVKIMDFGLATMQTSGLTKTGTVMGTPHYMSPEMVSGQHVDGRSDQFAVGVIMYELLTYMRPFTGDNISTILYKILNTEPKSFDNELINIYPELKQITERALKKDFKQRYPTMRHMANEIEKLLHKIITQGFTMDQPTMLIDDEMETVIMDTELDYTAVMEAKDSAKPAKKKRPLMFIAAFFILAAFAAGAYFLFIKKPATVGEVNNGYVVLDMKPYAEITEVKNMDTGQAVLLSETQKETPCRLSLIPGDYKITYKYPSKNNEERNKFLTVEPGKIATLRESVSESFIEEAKNHFKVFE